MTAQRKRTTWSGDGTPREAARSHQADIFTMNQEHPQPSPVEYESGSPDSWAETPTGNENVEQEYENGRVKRNELNFGEFRDDTFGKEREFGDRKYENKTAAATRKASFAERVARQLLRTKDEKAIANQALDLMALPGKALVSTLKRMDSLSPDALPKEQKFNRAMACCKVAALVTGFDEDRHAEASVIGKLNERLARTLMTLDDPTLREIVQVASFSRKAMEDEGDDDGEAAATAPTAGGVEIGEEDEEDEGGETAAKPSVAIPSSTAPAADGCMGAEDMAMLDNLLQQEMGQPAPAAPAPTGELTDLFDGAPAPAPAPGPAMPATPVASQGPDIEITFGDEVDDGLRTASDSQEDVAALEAVFSDNPEVQAQRELVAAAQEQAQREGGYGDGIRTASGARRLGNVQAGRSADVDSQLEGLWDRPPVG